MSLDVSLVMECNHCGRNEEVFSGNVTHNLNKMAQVAGIYDILWRPDEHDITTTSQITERLRIAIADMKANPDIYKAYNPANGWGTYDEFVTWLEGYLAACEMWPDAFIEVSR